MTVTTPRKTPVTNGGGMRQVRPDDTWTAQEIAAAFPISFDTLRRWRTEGIFVPTAPPVHRGSITMYVYSEDDLTRLLRFIAGRRSPVIVCPRCGGRLVNLLNRDQTKKAGTTMVHTSSWSSKCQPKTR